MSDIKTSEMLKDQHISNANKMTVDEKYEYVINMITLMIKRDVGKVHDILFSDLTETGKLTKPMVMQITSGVIKLSDLSPEVLFLIYNSLYNLFGDRDIIPSEYLFSTGDKQNAIFYKQQTFDGKFPLVFENVEILSPNQYSFSIDIRQLNEINKQGNLCIIGNMQRQERLSGVFSYVEFNDNVAQDIAKEIINGTYAYNAIRLHLVDDVFSTNTTDINYEYNEKSKTLTINSGLIACIDGQHRLAGIEYALFRDPNIEAKMIVIFTVGNEIMGQSIIVQEEKRQPILKDHIEKLKATKMTSIVNNIANDEILRKYVPFVATERDISRKVGIINRITFAKELQRKYDPTQEGGIKFYRDFDKKLKDFFYDLIEHNENFYLNVTKTNNILSTSRGEYVILRLFDLYYNDKDIRPILENEVLYETKPVPLTEYAIKKQTNLIFSGF